MSIMLRLTKINKTSDYIEAHYIPENSNELGYVKVNLADSSVMEYILTSFDKYTQAYFVQARNKLQKIKNDADIPKEIKVMWY